MRKFWLMFCANLRRTTREPIGFLIFILLPTVLLILNNTINAALVDPTENIVNGYNMSATTVGLVMMVLFMSIGGTIIMDYFYNDLCGAMRWRVAAAPISIGAYVFAMLLASVIYAMMMGFLIMTISYVFFNAYLHNVWVLLAVMLVLAILWQMVGMILAMLCTKRRIAEAIVGTIVVLMTFVGDLATNIFNVGRVGVFIWGYATPFAMAIRAVQYSGFVENDMNVALFNLGMLVAITVVLAIAVFALGRRRLF